MNTRSFTNNTNNTNNIERNNVKCTKLSVSFLELGTGALASHQQLPGSTKKSRIGLSSGQDLDSWMHRLEPGSGSQVEQRTESSSEGSHG